MRWVSKLTALVLLLGACKHVASEDYSYQISAGPAGYSVEVMKKGRPFITQDRLPAVEGNYPIPNEKVAAGLGDLYIAKLQKGKFPPSVSREEVLALLR